MEDTSDARQEEATCKFPHRPRYIPKLNQNSQEGKHDVLTHTALTEVKCEG